MAWRGWPWAWMQGWVGKKPGWGRAAADTHPAGERVAHLEQQLVLGYPLHGLQQVGVQAQLVV
jgi:hypothetical protein